MAYGERPASFLPTIKCSMCAKDIEISQMGEHVCGGPPAAGEPTPPLDSHASFDRMPYKANATQGPTYLGSSYVKPGRAPPPRVDTKAASKSPATPWEDAADMLDRPYFSQEELTPISASPSRNPSPVSPGNGQQSLFSKLLRSVTLPAPREPPSPEALTEALSANLDAAYPPAKNPTAAAQRNQHGGGYGGRGTLAGPEQMHAPGNPRDATAGGFLQRVNTIAPGPFDGRGKVPGGHGHQRNGSAGSRSNISPPSTAGLPGLSRSPTDGSSGSRSAFMTARQPRKNGYGGFGPPEGDDGPRAPRWHEKRFQTFPLRSERQEPSSRGPPEPRPQRDGMRSMSPARERRKLSLSGPDLTRTPQPRADPRLGEAPSMPSNLYLAEEFGIGNPYHTPTNPSSSYASGDGDERTASSRLSPPRVPDRSRRQASDTNKIDDLMADLERSMSDLQPRQMSSSRSPPRTRNPSPQQTQPPPRGLSPSLLYAEPPMDSAAQQGRLSPGAFNQRRPLSPLQARPEPPPLQRPSPATRPPTAQRPTSSKGHCKGCGDAIRGKSVSSADGRLTGRYHKQCFVCTSCFAPFQTATFYVIDDAPYCERHYHKLNGSVCLTCDRGIEGPYLESERREKFHPNCLTCADCQRSLRHDYFEINERVYCERDAFRRAQQGRSLGAGGVGGSNRMERRTTRMMMM
ncbi:hypothetical protein BUE80_DR008670 [Diplocarpon rosae]|nr:hypothetical protein BUE80_DR008670 [Diplocarpon rosae]